MTWALYATELLLLALAAFLIRRNIRTWQKYQHDKDLREQNFRWNQFRRRLGISVLMGAIAIVTFLTQSITITELRFFFGTALIPLGLLFLMLAISDFFVTRKHVSMMRDIKEVEGTSLPGGIKHRTTRDGRKLTLKFDPEPEEPEQKPGPEPEAKPESKPEDPLAPQGES